MNYGYWGALQEAWFVRRREGIRQGLIPPLTGSQWRSNLKWSSQEKSHWLGSLEEFTSKRLPL
jgi:hypothetical protein